MKKSLFLLALPLILGISSCNSENVQSKAVFLEDTLAHEEVFGIAQEAHKLGAIKHNAAADLVKPKIGVQYMISDENHDANTTISIRYVAAIASLDVTPVWTRYVAKQNDTAAKARAQVESTVAYTAINNNGETTIASDLGGDYNYFVVYTLKGIPYNEFQWSYIAAYLTLTDAENNTVDSEVVAVNVKQDHYFKFAVDAHDGYFLEGTINGVANQQPDLDPDSGNHAKKENLVLKANDTFGVFFWDETQFRFLGKADKTYENFYSTNESTLASNYAKVLIDGTYNLFVNNEDSYGLNAASISKDIYVDVSIWNYDGARFAVYAGDDLSGWTWQDMVKVVGETNIYKCHLDVSPGKNFIFCRMNGSTTDNKWDNRWAQTGNIDFEYKDNYHNASYNYFKITSNDGKNSLFDRFSDPYKEN